MDFIRKKILVNLHLNYNYFNSSFTFRILNINNTSIKFLDIRNNIQL